MVDRSLDDAKRRSIDRGARLIRAAAKVLDRNNGESLTVQEVADEAGQSLRTLYQYFGSKDDLLLAVFEEAMRTYAQLLTAAIAGFDDPLERVAAATIASGRLLALHGSGGRDRGLSQLRLQLSGAQPELVASAQQPVTALFRGLIADAVAAGQLPGRRRRQGDLLRLLGAQLVQLVRHARKRPGPANARCHRPFRLLPRWPRRRAAARVARADRHMR